MKLKFYIYLLIIIISGLPGRVKAQIPGHKLYNLFHPVPKQQMREMETDRPDVTESPYTVDAGHIQYEADFVRIEHERGEVNDQHRVILNNGNMKLGLTRTTAIQVGFETFVWQKDKQKDYESVKGHGIGDVTIRIKQNLTGDDGGNFVMAILPYVKFPTATYTDDSKYEGGIVVPMMIKLPGEWKIGSQIEADRLNN